MEKNSKQLDELLKSELAVCQKAGLTDDCGGERHMKQSESSNGRQQTPSPHNHHHSPPIISHTHISLPATILNPLYPVFIHFIVISLFLHWI